MEEYRRIEFKAICETTGDWRYGTYFYGVQYPDSHKGHYIESWEIERNTLCEYTGKLDKKNNKIFEWDINQDGGIVKWNADSASFVWEYPEETHEFSQENEWCEIVGNVYKK